MDIELHMMDKISFRGGAFVDFMCVMRTAPDPLITYSIIKHMVQHYFLKGPTRK